MKQLLLTGLMVLLFVSISAQKQNVYYLKDNGQQVAIKDSTDFIRIIREPGGTSKYYVLIEYYMNGTQKRLGHTSTIEPLKLEEQVAEYFPSGKVKRVATYKDGATTGEIFEKYPNGKSYRTFENILLKEDKASKSKAINRLREKVILYTDTSGKQLVNNGTGKYQEYNDLFTEIIAEGEVKNGLKQGEWKGYKKGKEYYTEIFNEGKLVSGTSYDSVGTKYSYNEDGEALPMFANGLTSMASFIQKTFIVPTSVAQKYRGAMRIEIGFTVEKDGRLTNIFPKNISIPKELNEEAIRVFEKSPPWTPGMQHGQPVRVAYTLPISIMLQ